MKEKSKYLVPFVLSQRIKGCLDWTMDFSCSNHASGFVWRCITEVFGRDFFAEGGGKCSYGDFTEDFYWGYVLFYYKSNLRAILHLQVIGGPLGVHFS